MLLPLLMNLSMFGGDTPEPPAPAAVTVVPSGGYLREHRISRKERAEEIRRQRVALGIIPDNVPVQAVEIIEASVAEQLDTLDRDEQEQVEALKAAFHVERLRWKQAYEIYYREYLDALMTMEMRAFYQRQRRRKLMVFVLMNS